MDFRWISSKSSRLRLSATLSPLLIVSWGSPWLTVENGKGVIGTANVENVTMTSVATRSDARPRGRSKSWLPRAKLELGCGLTVGQVASGTRCG